MCTYTWAVVTSYLHVVECSVFGTAADSRGRARGTYAQHQVLQSALFSIFARARVAHIGAVVLVRDIVAVKEAFLSCVRT